MTVIVHHANCPDGFTAAWLMNQALDGTPRIVAANWGDAPPDIDEGEHVYVVDFCYEPGELRWLRERAGKLVVLDHHETSSGWLVDAFGVDVEMSVDGIDSPLGLWLVCDQARSGATLAAWYTGVAGTEFEPAFVRYVEDRDLWRWKLKGTAEVFAAVTARPYTFDAYDELAGYSAQQLIEQGQGIASYRERLIEQTVETAWQQTILGHDDIWVAASPYAIGSDVAGRLAERDPDRFAAYFVQYGGRRKYGLRSAESGLNVAELAATVGGGGHPHAAGFEVGGHG